MRKEVIMRTVSIILVVIILVSAVPAYAGSRPIGLSVSGGIGNGYYSMSALNNHINAIRPELGVQIDDLSSGINLTVQGRLWIYNIGAITAGYQYLYAETEAAGSASLVYKAPADVYTIGAVGNVYRIPEVLDLNLAVSYCWVSAVFGTNLFSDRRLWEFKGTDNGWEIFAEAVTSFIRPVEIGLQIGYRMLKVENLEDRYGRSPVDYDGWVVDKMELEYSGVFFYLTAGIRI
jgi:hypothetical protein